MSQQFIESSKAEQSSTKKKRKIVKRIVIPIVSLLGLVIAAVCVVLWLVLTPARLTSIVNKIADKYILCESHFDNVNLTIIKTFPYVGLKVDDFYVVNPIEGASIDTVTKVRSLAVGINIKEYLKHNNIEVTEVRLNNASAYLYTNETGTSNFDIFPHSDKSESDTSKSFSLPNEIKLNRLDVNHLSARFCDDQLGVDANLDDLSLSLTGSYVDSKGVAKLAISSNQCLLLKDTSLNVGVEGLSIVFDGNVDSSFVSGDIKASVHMGSVDLSGQQWITHSLQSRDGDLLNIEGRLSGDYKSGGIQVDLLRAAIKNYLIELGGTVQLPSEKESLFVDAEFNTNEWQVSDVLNILPNDFLPLPNGMNIDAKTHLSGTVVGHLGDSLLPQINARLLLSDGSFVYRPQIPYSVSAINADIQASLDLNKDTTSNLTINKVSACCGKNRLSIKGEVVDLLGDMNTDAKVDGLVYLSDLTPLLPDSLNLNLNGQSKLNLRINAIASRILAGDMSAARLKGNIDVDNLDVDFDTILVQSPLLKIQIDKPSTLKQNAFDELLSLSVSTETLSAQLPNQAIDVQLKQLLLKPAVSNLLDTTLPLSIACSFDIGEIDGGMDSIKAHIDHPNGLFSMHPMDKKNHRVDYKIQFSSDNLSASINDSLSVDLGGLSVDGLAHFDDSKSNVLQQFAPNLDVEFKRGYVNASMLDYVVQIPDIKFNYKPEKCEISHANVVFGNSDFYLSGKVTGLEKWISHEDMLKGDLYFTSNYTNVDDLMDVFSGMGTNADTLERQRKEDKVDTSAHPFIVPKDVDVTLHTRIKEALAFDNELQEVAGDVRICDGIAVLNQVGFVCKAARMQLTGMYRTPRVNHIFVGLDFHLLDINIQELIDMIPYVDTLVPMLEDIEGAADFHLCAETYVNAFYKPKVSTLRAAAALTGQDLVVLDNKSIDKIAKLLQLKSWRENDSKIHVDSLDIAMTVFRDELEIFPFLLSLHKYQIVAEGRHNLSQNYDYHVELVQTPLPVRLAVDVKGTMPKLGFSLSPSLRYKNLYRPAKRSDVDEEVLRLKTMIRKSLEDNVKESTREYEGLESLD